MTQPTTPDQDPVTQALIEIPRLLLRQHDLLNKAETARRLVQFHSLRSIIEQLRKVGDALATQVLVVAVYHAARRADLAGQDATTTTPTPEDTTT